MKYNIKFKAVDETMVEVEEEPARDLYMQVYNFYENHKKYNLDKAEQSRYDDKTVEEYSFHYTLIEPVGLYDQWDLFFSIQLF